MFTITNEAIDPLKLNARLDDARAGALATFEGRVRNHNDGRQVEALEYEAYGALAVKEGERILVEARRRFAIYDCLCVHRTGKLAIGEAAVWVGVAAAHRAEAFEACRYIIDEVKHRLPIWKKEHYLDGACAWVNCAHEHAGGALHDWELDVLDLSSADLASFEIVDIREPDEDPGHILKALLSRAKVTQLPLSKLDEGALPLDRSKQYLFVSQRGGRSSRLVSDLRARGWENVYSLADGAEAVRRKFIA